MISSQTLKTFLVTFAVFMVVDLIWLGIIAQPIYDHFIGDFLAETPQWWAAILFYILFVVGLIYFALYEALQKKSLRYAIERGTAYGFFTYMTYELTNYAVIEDWPLGLVPIDIAWGIVLSLSVSSISYKLLSK